jgi:hypothetical protein
MKTTNLHPLSGDFSESVPRLSGRRCCLHIRALLLGAAAAEALRSRLGANIVLRSALSESDSDPQTALKVS